MASTVELRAERANVCVSVRERAERRAVLKAFSILSSIFPIVLPVHHHFLIIEKIVFMHQINKTKQISIIAARACGYYSIETLLMN